MEEKKIVVYVLHGFWENEFTNGCAVVDVSIDLEAVMKKLDEIVDELYSLSDCGCTLEDEAVKADLEMLEKYGFGSRAAKVRELCWK